MEAMMLKSLAKKQITTPHQKRVPTNDGLGTKLVSDGYTIADAELLIDIDGIMDALRHRAINSKSGQSKFMRGLVVLKTTNPRKCV
jgi:hypothetical protein